MSEHIQLELKQLDTGLPLPKYAHAGDAGLDLFSAEDLVLEPGARALIPTGIAIAIPEGYAGFVQPRSGLAIREGLSIVNTPGLIDSGYRGELKIIAINTDPAKAIEITRGERIAQLVIQAVPVVEIVPVEELDDTERSIGGFGSSGK